MFVLQFAFAMRLVEILRLNREDVDSPMGQSKRDVRLGRLINEWADGAHGRADRGIPGASEVVADPELDDLIPVVDALTISRTGIRNLIRQGVLSDPEDPVFQAELGHYGIIELIGRGGMGVVLRAFDGKLERDVAVKIMRLDLAGEPTAVVRFRREAKAAARLRHPNIVTIHEVGEAGGFPFLVLEYVDGPSLAEHLRRRGPMRGDDAREVFRQMIQGLAHAHDTGIIHRDIKPSNILLDSPSGTVKIADFGLARVVDVDTRITLAESVFGTPAYMSPEQARGDDRVDQRSDLYSAGVVLYEMLAGRLPFEGPSPSAVVHRVIHELPQEPRSQGDPAERELSRLAMRLLAKKPDDRIPTAQDVLAALDRPSPIRLPERRRRRLRRAAAGAATVAAAVILVVIAWLGIGGSSDAPISLGPLQKADSDVYHGGSSQRIVACYEHDMSWRLFYEFDDKQIIVQDAVSVERPEAGERLVVAGVYDPVRKAGLYVFNESAEMLWSLNATDQREWPDAMTKRPWECGHLVVDDVDGVPGDEVLVSCHGEDYPTGVSILDLEQRRLTSTFWHMGHVNHIFALDGYFTDGRPAIVISAFNNKLDGFNDEPPGIGTFSQWDITPVVMILDPLDMAGLGPPPTARITGIPPATPVAYALLDKAYIRTIDRITVDSGTGLRHAVPLDESFPEDGFAAIDLLRIAGVPPYTESCLLVRLAGIDYRNNRRPWGDLFVDRNLHPVEFKATNTGGTTAGLTLDYWARYWKVIVSEGQYQEP